MKNISCITLIFCVLLLCACQHAKDERLGKIYHLIDSNCQEALSQLYELEHEYDNADAHTQMWYKLVKYKAEEKCYVPHLSDSLISILAFYFEKHGNELEKREAFYHAGCTYIDLDNYPLALEWLGKAEQIAAFNVNATKNDTIALSRIYSQKAYIYNMIGDKDNGYESMMKSFHLQVAVQDADYRTYEDMGRFAALAGRMKEASKYFKTSATKMMEDDKLYEDNSYLGEQLAFYCEIKDRTLAEWTLNLIMSIPPDSLSANTLYSIAWYYSEMRNDIDSVLNYQLRALDKFQNLKRKANMAKDISRLLNKEGKKEKALKYALMSFVYSDSSEIILQKEKTLEVKERNYMTAIETAKEMRLKNKCHEKNISIWGLIIIFFAIVVSFMVVKMMRRNRSRIERLELEKDSIIRKKDLLQATMERDRQLRAETAPEMSTIKTKLSKIVLNPKELLNEDGWEDVFNVVDKQYPQFQSQIFKYKPKLNNKKLIVIYLLKMGCKQAEVAQIIGKSSSTISRTVHDINEVLGVSVEEFCEKYS